MEEYTNDELMKGFADAYKLLAFAMSSGDLDAKKKPQRLELKPIVFKDSYIKKWNVNVRDNYCNLYLDGKKLSDTIYRLGGMDSLDDGKDYYLILKYIEDHYEHKIMKACGDDKPKSNRHLGSQWCIIDMNGNEKQVLGRYDHIYLTGGQVYSNDKGYYNIETNEMYCKSSSGSRMNSKEFVFIENKYDDDKSKVGVLKINKADGTFELFPE